MAGPFELHRVQTVGVGQPVEREVPGQRMRPLVAQHVDGLIIAHAVVELDDEAAIAANALAQDGFGEPGSPNDHRHGSGKSRAKPA